MDVKEVITCKCTNCYDTFEVNDEVLEISSKYFNNEDYEGRPQDERKVVRWWCFPKTCLRCGKVYQPLLQHRKMDNFVLKAVQTIKNP